MKTFPLFLLPVILAASPDTRVSAQPYTFKWLIGAPGVHADGTNANARFLTPRGLCTGPAGALFVADGNMIRQVAQYGTNWVVTTVAGNLYSGALDGAGTNAWFRKPQGLAADASGNLYIADTANSTIRKITPAGAVSTIAGQALTHGSADGTNANARFNYPYDIAVSAGGTLYVADTENHLIRKIVPVGGDWVTTTIAGSAGEAGAADGVSSAARFDGPSGVALDSSGNLFVADFLNHTIRKLVPSGTNWIVTTLCGQAGATGNVDGTGTAARFFFPQSLAVDALGHILVTDSGNQTVRRISPGGTTSTIGGLPGASGFAPGTGSAARFKLPYGVAAAADGTLFVTDMEEALISSGTVAPLLLATLAGNKIVLSWPQELASFLPQVKPGVDGGSWTTITAGIVVAGDYRVVTNQLQPGAVFYRLIRQ